MSGYPTDRKRTGYFARFTKALFAANATKRVGGDAVLLVILVASREDRLHYSTAPQFWRAELMDRLDAASPNTLARVRQKAVDAGLLHYEEGSRTQAPAYWTLTPEWLSRHMRRAQKLSASKSTRSKIERESERETERILEPSTHKEKESEVSDSAPYPVKVEGKPVPSPPKPKYTQSDMEAARYLWSRVLDAAGENHRPPNFEKWASDVRKIRELDSRSPEEIRAMIDVAHGDDFWRTNILSPGKLREQWLRLSLLKNKRQPASTQQAESKSAGGIPSEEQTRRILAAQRTGRMAEPRFRGRA